MTELGARRMEEVEEFTFLSELGTCLSPGPSLEFMLAFDLLPSCGQDPHLKEAYGQFSFIGGFHHVFDIIIKIFSFMNK